MTSPAWGGLCRLKPAFQAIALSGGVAVRDFARLRRAVPAEAGVPSHCAVRGEWPYVTSPAWGGLCRLKPAFQAVARSGGMAVRESARLRWAVPV